MLLSTLPAGQMECNIEVIDLLSRPPGARVQRQAFSDIVGGRHVVGGSRVCFEFLVAVLSTGGAHWQFTSAIRLAVDGSRG